MYRDLAYNTVNRKTIPRGVEIVYSHIVFDKKYKIDPETKRNVFLKWKVRLLFDGNKQKTYQDTFSPTPSLPMIRTLLAEYCTQDWEVRHRDPGNTSCDTPLEYMEGRSLYVNPPSEIFRSFPCEHTEESQSLCLGFLVWQSMSLVPLLTHRDVRYSLVRGNSVILVQDLVK